ncbi:MAG: hypothetical protein KAH01_07725 [Caldisericia bacterium]|nr:hypothetical protein [Caldisericia bacterium]
MKTLGQEITNDLIKQKLSDGNGGTAWVFAELFKRIGVCSQKVDDLEKLLQPILKERSNRRAVVGWFGNAKANISAFVIFIFLIADLVVRIANMF